MGGRSFETMSNPTRRWRAVALMLLVCLIVAGCAERDSAADKDREGGFYGGVSGGMTR